MSTGDDRDWLEALAGRSDAASTTAACAEGQTLRRALRILRGERTLTAPELPEPAVTRLDPAREQALIARALREGLLPQARPRLLAGWRPLLAAAGVAFLGVGIAWMIRDAGDADVVRGARERIVRLEAGDPGALQRQILAELRAAGAEASGYEALGVQGIDAELPRPVPAAVARVLEVHGIEVPDDGVLLIEIRERR